MADWEVLSQIFGDEAGPLQVLLIFSDEVTEDDISALEHNVPFNVELSQINSAELEDFKSTFCQLVKGDSGISVDPDSMLLVEFKNERELRAEGAAFMMKLVSNSNLHAAYKMTNSDIEQVMGYARQFEDVRAFVEASEKMRTVLETYIFRKANLPKNYIRNYKEIIEMHGYFGYELDGNPIAFDIDRTKFISVESSCDQLLNMLISVPKLEFNDIAAQCEAFLEGLKIV